MKRSATNSPIITLLLLLYLLVLACIPPSSRSTSAKKSALIKQQDTSQIDEIIYYFAGPAVAPRYSQSFIITINRNTQKLTVDSIKTRTINVEKPVTEAEFVELVAFLDHYNISVTEPLAEDGCMGGTGETLTLKSQGVEILTGDRIDCAGQQRSNFQGNVDGFIRAIKMVAFGDRY